MMTEYMARPIKTMKMVKKYSVDDRGTMLMPTEVVTVMPQYMPMRYWFTKLAESTLALGTQMSG